MSRFIDDIKAELTGKRRQVLTSVYDEPLSVNIKPEDDIKASYAVLPEYKVGVEWIRRLSCDPKDVHHLLENVVREIREAIYGDIKGRILRLERAVYEQDRKAILSETRDIIREIFG